MVAVVDVCPPSPSSPTATMPPPPPTTTTKGTGWVSLQPHTTHVSRARIQKTWRPLAPAAQERVKQLLLMLQREAQAQQPGMSVTRRRQKTTAKAVKEEQLRAQAEQAVDEAVARLIRRIPRMPFPAAAKRQGSAYEADFDLEATLARVQQLEAELAERVQGARVLREHVRREEAALRADRAAYAVLEAGARSEQRLAREQARKLHPLVDAGHDERSDADDDDDDVHVDMDGFDVDSDSDAGRRQQPGQGQDEDGDDDADAKQSPAFEWLQLLSTSAIEQDEQLKTLVAQLRQHVHLVSQDAGTGLANVTQALDGAERSLGELLAATGR